MTPRFAVSSVDASDLRRVFDIRVYQRLERVAFIAPGDAEQQEHQLLLTIGHVPHRVHQRRYVPLLFALDDCRWMLARAREIGTRVGALNLDEPLRAATDGADLFAERGQERRAFR